MTCEASKSFSSPGHIHELVDSAVLTQGYGQPVQKNETSPYFLKDLGLSPSLDNCDAAETVLGENVMNT